MYASFKSLVARSVSPSHARRLTLSLCLCSLVASLWVYLLDAPLPLLIVLLNLATLMVVGLQQWRSRTAIKFEPQELAAR